MADAAQMPPPAIEIQHEGPEIPLIAEASVAVYDAQKQIASITIERAFGTRNRILNYNGKYVTLIYRKHIVDIEECPIIVVDARNVRQDMPNIFFNTVELHIARVSKDLADLIARSKCLRIRTGTVKAIIGRYSFEIEEPRDPAN
jgi:hypothetical protein